MSDRSFLDQHRFQGGGARALVFRNGADPHTRALGGVEICRRACVPAVVLLWACHYAQGHYGARNWQ